MTEPTRFKPGGLPGPGRPKGSVGGRAATIQLIDDILTEHGAALRAALEAEFKKNPVKFWQRFGFPLVPQSLVAKVETTANVGPWVSLLEVMRLREVERIAQRAGLALPPAATNEQQPIQGTAI